MVYLGWFCGAIIFGMISDSFGRKTSLLLSIGLMSIAGITSSFVNIFWFFALLKVLVGAGIGKLVIQILYLITLLLGESRSLLRSGLVKLRREVKKEDNGTEIST